MGDDSVTGMSSKSFEDEYAFLNEEPRESTGKKAPKKNTRRSSSRASSSVRDSRVSSSRTARSAKRSSTQKSQKQNSPQVRRTNKLRVLDEQETKSSRTPQKRRAAPTKRRTPQAQDKTSSRSRQKNRQAQNRQGQRSGTLNKAGVQGKKRTHRSNAQSEQHTRSQSVFRPLGKQRTKLMGFIVVLVFLALFSLGGAAIYRTMHEKKNAAVVDETTQFQPVVCDSKNAQVKLSVADVIQEKPVDIVLDVTNNGDVQPCYFDIGTSTSLNVVSGETMVSHLHTCDGVLPSSKRYLINPGKTAHISVQWNAKKSLTCEGGSFAQPGTYKVQWELGSMGTHEAVFVIKKYVAPAEEEKKDEKEDESAEGDNEVIGNQDEPKGNNAGDTGKNLTEEKDDAEKQKQEDNGNDSSTEKKE